jgi:hypothetical protein
MFKDAYKFNQPLSHFNTSCVKDMSLMFENARRFNQSIQCFDLGKVTTLCCMFNRAMRFTLVDQNLLSCNFPNLILNDESCSCVFRDTAFLNSNVAYSNQFAVMFYIKPSYITRYNHEIGLLYLMQFLPIDMVKLVKTFH